MTPPERNWSDVSADVVRLLEMFYRARIDQPKLLTPSDAEDRSRKAIQGVLDGELFARVQRKLGLLQTVIVYGLPPNGPTPHYQHLEPTLRISVPWLRVQALKEDESTWQTEPETREDAMKEVFRKFREDPSHGVQEFAQFLGAAGKESEDWHHSLSPSEREFHYLLVEDGEMSFFSLLAAILEARASAGSLDEVQNWIHGSSRMELRSILRQDDLDGPPKEPNKSRVLEVPWHDHYWAPATFDEAMSALGFRSCRGVSNRFERMLLWLDGQDTPVALLNVHVQRRDRRVSLAAVVKEILQSFENDKASRGNDTSRKFASLLAAVIDEARFSGSQSDELIGSDVLRKGQGLLRFNLPGEYLLRRDESISRSFFATTLSTVSFAGEGTHATAFALGTLQDLDSSDKDIGNRLALLRRVVDGIADFGLSQRFTEVAADLALGYKTITRVRWTRHTMFTALNHLKTAIASSHASGSEVQNGFSEVYTLCEYMMDYTSQGSQWSSSLNGMFTLLEKWFGSWGGRTIKVEYLAVDVTFTPTVSRSLSIVLYNLMDNAFKCADAGGLINVGGKKHSKLKSIDVWIQNTGSAMSKPFADFLQGKSDEVPKQGTRHCMGLDTVRTVLLEELKVGYPRVEAPAAIDLTGTRIIISLPESLAWGGSDERR